VTLEFDRYTSNLLLVAPAQCYVSTKVEVLRLSYVENKKAVLPQGNRAMPQVFFSVELRQQHSQQV